MFYRGGGPPSHDDVCIRHCRRISRPSGGGNQTSLAHLHHMHTSGVQERLRRLLPFGVHRELMTVHHVATTAQRAIELAIYDGHHDAHTAGTSRLMTP